MITGMLWFDNDPRMDFNTKILRASAYYQKKYGQKPNLCYVHPSMPHENPSKSSGVDIQTNQMVLPNHFWLGIKQSIVSA
jgi:hypothetical protein